MRPSLLSAIALIVGLFSVAGLVALAMGVAAEWDVIAGAPNLGGSTFALVAVIEAALILVLAGLISTMRLRSR